MRNNIPIIGEVKEPTTSGRPIIRMEVRITHDKKFLTEVFVINNQAGEEGKKGWDKVLLKPEIDPVCALVSGQLAILRKLSKDQ